MISSNIFEVKNKDGVIFLQFPAFNKTELVKHGFSTKVGGISTGIFNSMNLSYNRGDNKDNVDINFQRFCKAIGVNRESLFFSDQIHEDKIHIVKELGEEISGIDSLITDNLDVTLVTSFADCVPLFFLDPVKRVIALAHAGWRGTVKNIAGKTVEAMKREFACDEKNILAGIGPSIGACCFEVSEDVKLEVEKLFHRDIIDKIVKKNNDKYIVDLWQANKELLLRAGLLSQNIEVTDLCTMCNKDVLFSHRGTNGKRGNMVAMMALK